MRQHPALGVEMLRPVAKWGLLAPIIHTHHERWDGHGYPRGLAGSEIPLGGRIVAVAEAFEAMTRSTPYGTRRTLDEALAEIEACAGTQFDPGWRGCSSRSTGSIASGCGASRRGGPDWR